MGRFVPSPGFEGRAKRDPAMRAMLRERATRAAGEAERIGQTVASSYRATVTDEGEDGVRIEANTDGINAASWIEFGTGEPAPTPAYAPLRKGAEAAGLNLRGDRQ